MTLAAALLLGLVLPTVAGAALLAQPSGDDASPPSAGASARPPADIVLARGLACGLGTWLLGSGLLARTVGLTSTSAWVWDAVVAVVSLAVLALPRHRSRAGAALGVPLRRLAEVGGLAVVVFAPVWWVVARTSWSPLGSTPWYYYGLARQVAEVGSIPATSVEFGTTTPFLNDYHLFTTGTAMLLTQYGGGPIVVVNTVCLLSALTLAVGMAALTSSLGAGRFATLLSVPIALAAGIGPQRLAAYRAEGFALGLTVLLAALGIHWLRTGDRRSLVAAGVLAATLSQVHGIAALTAGVMVVAAALVQLARGPRREQLKRTGIALAALVVGVLVAGLAFHEASGTVHAGGLVDRGGLDDPTWEFFRAARGEAMSLPPSNLSMIENSFTVLYAWQRWWFVPVLLLALVGLWRTRRDEVTRGVVGFTLLSLAGLLAVASVFMLAWQGYVPRRTGASRLILEMSLVGPPLIAVGLERLVASPWRWRGRQLLPRPRAGVAVLLALLTASGLVSLVRVADYDDDLRPTRAQLAVWQSIPATDSDVVLANGYTEGFIPDVTGADGLLDGRAPYTFGRELARADQLLRSAQAFYDDPAGHWNFLAAHHVTWVVVGDDSTNSLSTRNVWSIPPDLTALEACAGLRRTASTRGLTVFRVVDARPQGCSRS